MSINLLINTACLQTKRNKLMRGKNLRGNFGCLLNKFIYLILLHFAKAINMNQADFLASLIFGCLPIPPKAGQWFYFAKNTSPMLPEQSYSCASARDFHTVPFWSLKQDLIHN